MHAHPTKPKHYVVAVYPYPVAEYASPQAVEAHAPKDRPIWLLDHFIGNRIGKGWHGRAVRRFMELDNSVVVIVGTSHPEDLAKEFGLHVQTEALGDLPCG